MAVCQFYKAHKKLTAMIFLGFVFLGSSYIELTAGNCDSIIGGVKPVFVKFYSPNCPFCKAMAQDFDDSATAFTGVAFAGIDCDAYPTVCSKYDVTGHPVLKLFPAHATDGILFNETRSMDNFCDFIENYTGFKGNRPVRSMTDVTPVNLEKLLAVNRCFFVIFYTSWCTHSKRFLPEARIAGGSLIAEPNVSIGGVNCENYKELCETYKVESYPVIKLFKNGTTIDFPGDRSAEGVMSFLNENCAINREVGGLLGPTAGLIPEAREIVTAFLSEDDKQSAIERMKTIPKAEFYVKVMERYISSGVESIKQDMAKMMEIMKARRGAWASIDGMKERYNVFAEFIPKETATPVPTVEYQDDEEPLLVPKDEM
jgi:thioredoxin-like negative regulator of GroEL